MKKKGFTLIELIVVIAIIGVLAAILVPAMLGYVRKSKITTANTTAKQVYNAYNTALVDLDTTDSTDGSLTAGGHSINGTSWDGTNGNAVENAVYGYFSDITKVKDAYIVVDTSGSAIVGCSVLNGKYPGCYPKQWTVEIYKTSSGPYNSAQAAYLS